MSQQDQTRRSLGRRLERTQPQTTTTAPQLPPEPEDDAPVVDERHKVFGLGIPTAEARQPAYGQGVVVSLLAAAGMLLLAIISIGDGDRSDPPVLEQTDVIFWVIAAIVMIASAVGAQVSERTAARAGEAVGQPRPPTSMATAWTVPLVSAFAAVMLVATFHNRPMLIVGPLIAFLGISGSLLSRDLLDESDERSSRAASTIHTLVVHVIGFLAFSGIYLNKLDSWVSAPLAGIVGLLLIMETLERGGAMPAQRVFYAVLGGWVLGTVMIPLNWWPTHGWVGGAVLLAVFYATAGILLVQTQRDRIVRRDLVEFGGVSGVALLILAVFG